MGKEIINQVQEAQIPRQDKPQEEYSKNFVRYKLTKIKDKNKILKAAREKQQIMYKETSIKLSANFSTETLQARREWQDIFQVTNGKKLRPRLIYPARLSLRFDGEVKGFTDKQKLREFSTTKSALQQMLKELLQAGKHKRKKRPTRNKLKTIKKMVIGSRACVHAFSVTSVMSNSLQHRRLYLTRLPCPWDSAGQNIGMGSHALLQGNLPNPGIEPTSPALQAADSLPTKPSGKPNRITHIDN